MRRGYGNYRAKPDSEKREYFSKGTVDFSIRSFISQTWNRTYIKSGMKVKMWADYARSPC